MVRALGSAGSSRSALAVTTASSAQATCSSDIERQLQSSARFVNTFCARLTLVGDSTIDQRPKKDNVAAARGDKPEKDELGDETEEDAMAVQDDGDIKDRRMCPHVLSSPHLGQRLDHGSIHVLTRAADQDEVVANRADELGDETVEQANAVLADDDLAANKDWRACPHVAHPILVGDSADQNEVAAAAAGVDEHAKDELGDETLEQASRVQAEDGGREQGSGSWFPCSVCTLHISVGDTRKDQCAYPRDRLS